MNIKITDHEIHVLSAEAARAGDTLMEAICVLAVEGRSALRLADPGTDQRRLLEKRSHTQAWARQQCATAISAARAQEQS